MASRSERLLADALKILGANDRYPWQREASMKCDDKGIDKQSIPALKSGLNQFSVTPQRRVIMAKRQPTASKQAETQITPTEPVLNTQTGEGAPATAGTAAPETGTDLAEKPKSKQELDAEAVQAKMAAKQAKLDAAAAKKEAAEKAKAERRERIVANKEARAAKLAELTEGTERTYTGSMLSLQQRVKEGAYVKSSTGQLRAQDDLAVALDFVPPGNVVVLGLSVLGLETNPYSALNMGQQSMNLRNKMRGAIKQGKLTLDAVKAKIAELGLDTYKGYAEEQAAKKAKREQEKLDKAAAKAKAAEKKEPEAEAATA